MFTEFYMLTEKKNFYKMQYAWADPLSASPLWKFVPMLLFFGVSIGQKNGGKVCKLR